MKKGLLYGIIAIVSMISFTAFTTTKNREKKKRVECVDSRNFVGTETEWPLESEATNALANFMIMWGLTHNVTSYGTHFNGCPYTGCRGYYFTICGEAKYD